LLNAKDKWVTSATYQWSFFAAVDAQGDSAKFPKFSSGVVCGVVFNLALLHAGGGERLKMKLWNWLLLPESTAWPLLLRWALQWPLKADLASSKGEDESSVVQY